MEDLKLGEDLVRAGYVTSTQLKQALDLKKSLGGDLKEILVKMGFVKEEELSRHLAAQQEMQTVDPTSQPIDTEAMRRIPRKVLERHTVVPLRGGEGRILLAVHDPNDYQVVDEIQFLTNKKVETAVASKNAIRKALNRYFAGIEEKGPPSIEDVLATIRRTPVEDLIRATVAALVRSGKLEGRALLDALNRSK